MRMLNVALLQMASCGTDQAANLAKGEAFCRRARQMGADIALFPEMWSIGYTGFCPSSDDLGDLWRAPERWAAGATNPYEAYAEAREQWQAQAINRDSAYVAHFRALARELGMAIAVTYLEQWPSAPRNAVSLIDRHGALALTYAKVHTCDFDPKEAALTPGDDFFVTELDTAQGSVHIGTMICYDREFPESAGILMLKGAELILIPNACDIETNRIAQLRTRAYDNMLAVALANYAAPQQNGHSIAFDPIAFDSHGSRDTLVIEAGGAEGVYLAPFDLQALRDFRQRETWGNAFRRPHRYGLLTSQEVSPPFLRVNDKGEPYPRTRR
jgi:predicted amidohydrolase